jgi:hypothetical protein
MTAKIIPLETDRLSPRDVIAQRLSGTVKPSPARMLEAAMFIDALFDAGWEIVPRGSDRN